MVNLGVLSVLFIIISNKKWFWKFVKLIAGIGNNKLNKNKLNETKSVNNINRKIIIINLASVNNIAKWRGIEIPPILEKQIIIDVQIRIKNKKLIKNFLNFLCFSITEAIENGRTINNQAAK